MPAAVSKNYVFTINNPTAPVPFSEPDMHCLVYQLERGELGTPHYQGYVEFKRRVSLTTAQRLLGAAAHLERRRGTRRQAIDYSMKEDTRVEGPWTFGNWDDVTQGKRSDIKEFKEWFFAMDRTIDDCVDEYPEIMAKYPRFYNTLRGIKRRRNFVATPFAPNPGWQTELATYLTTPPDPRKVKWLYDTNGGNGKSYFALNWRSTIQPYVCTGGRFGDIFYSFLNAGTPNVVFFDWPRDHEDRFPYGLIETFKNGYFISTKYESECVRFPTPHVVIFSNFPPDQTKLSLDRWDIINIE